MFSRHCAVFGSADRINVCFFFSKFRKMSDSDTENDSGTDEDVIDKEAEPKVCFGL